MPALIATLHVRCTWREYAPTRLGSVERPSDQWASWHPHVTKLQSSFDLRVWLWFKCHGARGKPRGKHALTCNSLLQTALMNINSLNCTTPWHSKQSAHLQFLTCIPYWHSINTAHVLRMHRLWCQIDSFQTRRMACRYEDEEQVPSPQKTHRKATHLKAASLQQIPCNVYHVTQITPEIAWFKDHFQEWAWTAQRQCISLKIHPSLCQTCSHKRNFKGQPFSEGFTGNWLGQLEGDVMQMIGTAAHLRGETLHCNLQTKKWRRTEEAGILKTSSALHMRPETFLHG